MIPPPSVPGGGPRRPAPQGLPPQLELSQIPKTPVPALPLDSLAGGGKAQLEYARPLAGPRFSESDWHWQPGSPGPGPESELLVPLSDYRQ